MYLSNGDAKKQINRGKAGIIGLYGLQILMHPEKRKNIIKVLKTEGPSCAMTLWAAMDPEDRDRFPIVTNSSGAGETMNLHRWGQLFLDLDVATIHDSDLSGQDGVTNWQEEVGPFCKTFCNVVLHDEVAEKRGPDLRDWLNAGGTWVELKAMILNAKPLVVSDRQALLDMSETDRALHQIGCTVIGDLGGHYNKIQIYSKFRRDYFDISPSHLNEYQISQIFGEAVGGQVKLGTLKIEQIRGAIAAKTSECGRVNPHNRIGPGIWCSRDKDRLAVVGEQGLFIYDEAGGLELQKDPRFDGRAALLRTDDFTAPWFDEDLLKKYVKRVHDDREVAIEVLRELNDLFLIWDNLRYGSDDSLLLTGLTVSTIIQDVWEIRPQVWLSGPTDSGKTELTRKFESMFGPLMARMDAPTEAGFRNYIQNQKRFCTIDEFEKSPHRKKIIETLRSTTKGGTVFRATSDHKSVSFPIRHQPWFTGTNRGFEKFAADLNRVIKIDLKAPTPEQYQRGQQFPSQKTLRDLGHKIIAVAIVYWKKMLEMETALSRVSIEGIAHRIVECYAVPTAVHAAVMGYEVEGAVKMLTEILDTRKDDVQQVSNKDEVRMLQFILSHSVQVGSVPFPLIQLALNKHPISGSDKTGK